MQNPVLSPYPREEVNLLSESLLQIGTGLRREVNYTKIQIGSIFQQLKQFNTSLTKLSEQVNHARKLGEELDTKTRSFEDNNHIYEVLAEISEELGRLQREGTFLEDMIKPLEMKVQIALDTKEEKEPSVNTSLILSTIEKQNMQIEALQAIVDSHQDHISDQESKIQRLLRKTSSKNMKAKKRRNIGAQRKSKDGSICQTVPRQQAKETDTYKKKKQIIPHLLLCYFAFGQFWTLQNSE
ncbi:angiopoietin-related protein 3-like [Gastrophryne carolinensis]